MDTRLIGEFIGGGHRVHAAQVAVSERVGTEGGVHGILRAAVRSGVGLQNIDGWEKISHERTRLVLE